MTDEWPDVVLEDILDAEEVSGKDISKLGAVTTSQGWESALCTTSTGYVLASGCASCHRDQHV